MFSGALQKETAPARSKYVSKYEPISWAEAFLLSSAVIVAAIPAIAGLYLIKSALGINLMDGPSPLHDLLYHFIV